MAMGKDQFLMNCMIDIFYDSDYCCKGTVFEGCNVH